MTQTMTKEQTAVEWIADRFRQYQKEGYKSNWDEVIQTVLLAKEIEDKQLSAERERAGKLVDVVEKLSKMGPIWNLFGLVDEAKQTLKEYNENN